MVRRPCSTDWHDRCWGRQETPWHMAATGMSRRKAPTTASKGGWSPRQLPHARGPWPPASRRRYAGPRLPSCRGGELHPLGVGGWCVVGPQDTPDAHQGDRAGSPSVESPPGEHEIQPGCPTAWRGTCSPGDPSGSTCQSPPPRSDRSRRREGDQHRGQLSAPPPPAVHRLLRAAGLPTPPARNSTESWWSVPGAEVATRGRVGRPPPRGAWPWSHDVVDQPCVHGLLRGLWVAVDVGGHLLGRSCRCGGRYHPPGQGQHLGGAWISMSSAHPAFRHSPDGL